MELTELVGEHLLDGVDFDNAQVKMWGETYEDCNVMRFRLDGVAYCATEDPNDGYRSCLRDLTVVPSDSITNTFDPIRVIGRHRTKGQYGEVDDVLELIAVETGGIVIEVGTINVADYYPIFEAQFHPEQIQPTQRKAINE